VKEVSVKLTTNDRMSAVRAKVAKERAALQARKKPAGKKTQGKRKRVDDEEDADDEETGQQGKRRKNPAGPEKEKRVTRSEAAKSVDRPRPKRIVKNK
jgi:hypothetical protein